MLSDKIKQVLAKHYDYTFHETVTSDADYQEILLECGKILTEEDRDSHRWWDTFYLIKEFQTSDDERYLIGYSFASANRDESIFELGWEFDDESVSFCEEKEKVTVVKYYNQLTDDEVTV